MEDATPSIGGFRKRTGDPARHCGMQREKKFHVKLYALNGMKYNEL